MSSPRKKNKNHDLNDRESPETLNRYLWTYLRTQAVLDRTCGPASPAVYPHPGQPAASRGPLVSWSRCPPEAFALLLSPRTFMNWSNPYSKPATLQIPVGLMCWKHNYLFPEERGEGGHTHTQTRCFLLKFFQSIYLNRMRWNRLCGSEKCVLRTFVWK